MARRRYVSIKEVAARAGVSFQTASKVLNGGDVRVSVETEERILAAATELGYRPNTIARSLVQRATATIGLVASDATDVAIAQASVAAEQAARKNGHSVLVGHLAAGGADGADIVRTLIERRVDGIIAAAPEVEEDTEVAELLRRYVPSVSLQAVPGGGVPLVGSNHRETGRLAATHLLGLGHTSIGTVTGTFRRRVTRSRLHGYEDALRDAGLEPSEDLVAEGDWTPPGGATGRCSAGSSSTSDGASTAGCTKRARRCPTTGASARTCSACSASCGSGCCAGRAGTSSATTTGPTVSGPGTAGRAAPSW